MIFRPVSFIILLIFLSLGSCKNKNSEGLSEDQNQLEQISSSNLFGIDTSQYILVSNTIKRNEFFAKILSSFNLESNHVAELTKKVNEIFDLRKVRFGKNYHALLNPADSSLSYLVYEHSAEEYLKLDFQDSLANFELIQREVSYCNESLSSSIESSLYNAIVDKGANPLLANRMSRIYDWSIDFFRLQKGDSFTVLYERRLLDGKSNGIGQIIAGQFTHEGNTYHAYYYPNDSNLSYYDEEGGSLKRRYLKAPLEFSRISSRYSKRRFHPVQKRFKAHLGVDYAAPKGTPIRAIGDGKVLEARYKAYNGNYVKIRHTSAQASQYLHLSKIANGIKSGKRVEQGEIIGYVGSTGLATGPHLCFRFWENGKQINPLNVQAPPTKPLEKEQLPEYLRYCDSLQKILNFTPQQSLTFHDHDN